MNTAYCGQNTGRIWQSVLSVRCEPARSLASHLGRIFRRHAAGQKHSMGRSVLRGPHQDRLQSRIGHSSCKRPTVDRNLTSAMSGHVSRRPDVSRHSPQQGQATGPYAPTQLSTGHHETAGSQIGHRSEAGHISGAAAHFLHNHAKARHDEGCAGASAPRQHHDDSRHLCAANTGKRARGGQCKRHGRYSA